MQFGFLCRRPSTTVYLIGKWNCPVPFFIKGQLCFYLGGKSNYSFPFVFFNFMILPLCF
jgi:hypothetical protein